MLDDLFYIDLRKHCRIWALVYARGNEERINDFTSIAYEAAIKSIPRYNPKAMPLLDFTIWMGHCAIVDEIRKYYRRKKVWDDNLDVIIKDPIINRTPFHDLCEKDIFNHPSLSRNELVTLHSIFIEGKSYKEISKSLKLQERSIGPILRRALSKIKDLYYESNTRNLSQFTSRRPNSSNRGRSSMLPSMVAH